jgi:hypothetical protein
MLFPQVVILALDDWLSRQVHELVKQRGWLLRDARQFKSAKKMLAPPRPTVLIAQLDPRQEKPDGPQFLADVHLSFPDVLTLAVSDIKINHDDERAQWTATMLDLGAKAVMYPPLTKPVLEEVLGQMMSAVYERARSAATPTISQLTSKAAKKSSLEPIIDLAEEGLADL